MPTKALSRVQALIQGVLEERAARGLGNELPETKVTLRLNAADAFWLSQLAELMDASRTRAASQLLSAAVRDAAHAAGLPTEGEAFKTQLKAFLDAELPQETPPIHDN
ncbi:hypothetical protein [Deinococcus hopiensis]|uniref:Uncharacterized protein n=1 Tax=Deinococcus hopiensis KR-140 TaxID=695939 RepID=A0A1W1UDF2_9DEIO|nr:hypothetical protein [Deinococcus hopiensis]SMB79107.1 hypothetical protein SAMN00790413_05765 [Deinococcus hopiensis KR-140]